MSETNGLFCVRPKGKRKRVMSLSADERKQIVYLFDAARGDAGYVAERCGIIGIQRADVLAVVLAETRRKGPDSAPGLCVMAAGRVA